MHQYCSNLEWAYTIRQREKYFLALSPEFVAPSTKKRRPTQSLYGFFQYFWLTSALLPKEILEWLEVKADPEVKSRARLFHARPAELMAQLLSSRLSTQLRLKRGISTCFCNKIIRI